MSRLKEPILTETSVTERPRPPRAEVRLVYKKQPFYTWTCNWKQGRRRCNKGKDGKPLKTRGPELGIIERNADRHWEVHLREAAGL
jgi:hypothetical protein